MSQPEDDGLQMTMTEAAQAIASRKISSLELTQAAIARARALQSRFNAFVRIDEAQALDAARACDQELARGAVRGPLHGVPIAHKDMFYRAGKVSTCGSKLRENWVADTTATVLQKLDAAGAIQIGTLHMTEFAYGPTGQNAWLGDAKNPWNPQHITGGSSSGSGIVTAARIAFGALGSDTAGSVRMPAGICGVTGMKTTYGLVSRAGCMPLSASLDTVGTLTRTVEDNALMLSVIAGHDPADPASAKGGIGQYSAAASAGKTSSLKGFRIGVPIGFFDQHLTAEVAGLLADAASAYRTLGAEVVEVAMPDLDAVNAAGVLLTWGDVISVHGENMRERSADFTAQTRGRIEITLAAGAQDYLDAQRYRGRALREFAAGVFSRCDALLAPVLSFPVPKLEEVDVSGGPNMMRILDEITRLMRPINVLGLPALALPCGFTKNGLPCGMQLIGRPFAESLLYRLGAAYQGTTDWHARLPPAAG
jgi:aspartyl-tRNA(Asn)/glutamyl-tRNA(Gln) amidotransferase subunit A